MKFNKPTRNLWPFIFARIKLMNSYNAGINFLLNKNFNLQSGPSNLWTYTHSFTSNTNFMDCRSKSANCLWVVWYELHCSSELWQSGATVLSCDSPGFSFEMWQCEAAVLNFDSARRQFWTVTVRGYGFKLWPCSQCIHMAAVRFRSTAQ